MSKNLKWKNIIKVLLPLSVLSITSPFIAASCQNTARFDQEQSQSLKIMTSYGPSNDLKRYNALKSVIEEYNKYVKLNKDKNQNLQPVELKVSADSLQGLYSKINLDLRAKNTKNFGNLVLAYPSSAVLAGTFDMLLDLDSVNTDYINPEFLKINQSLSGLKKDKKWILPFGRSSEVLTVDKPLLGYIVQEMDKQYKKQKHVSILDENNSDILKSSIELFNSDKITENERTRIEELWKFDQYNLDFSKLSLEKLSDDILDSYDQMIEFTKFVNSTLNDNENYSDTLYTMGIDSIANFVYLQLFNDAKNDFSKYFLQPKEGASYKLDYKKVLSDPESKEYQTFAKYIEKTLELINSGRTYIQRDPTYDFNSARIQTTHKMIFATGTTLAYNYVRFVQNSFLYKGKDISYLANGFAKRNKDDTNNSDTLAFNVGLDKFTLDLNSQSQHDEFAKGVAETNQLKLIKNFLGDNNSIKTLYASNEAKKLAQSNNDFQKIYLPRDWSSEGKYTDAEKQQIINTITAIQKINPNKINEIAELEKQLPNSVDRWFLLKNVAESQSDKYQLKLSNTLITPQVRYNSKNSGERGSFILQGPSLMALHSNEKQDKATLEFIKWLYDENNLITWEDLNKKTTPETRIKLIPIEYFAYKSNYIFPSNNFFNQSKHLKINEFASTFIKATEEINLGKGVSTFEEPVDESSDTFRNAIRGSLQRAFEQARYHDNKIRYTKDKVINEIKTEMSLVTDLK
ncbi:P68 family surface lipoprotein [[Mycoplasma] gypis]|uniref:P80 family lipoprotein n=1 Tax=[Mycoplasma] gypis TaxID=92404 RepID=A0ABZ2RMT9_9BACT|nr:P80 family lipoprotein [[Mycoplasma] gypis]MBN0919668.1 hypothetical protein [[Mycoplasma] gypis]